MKPHLLSAGIYPVEKFPVYFCFAKTKVVDYNNEVFYSEHFKELERNKKILARVKKRFSFLKNNFHPF